MKDRRTLTVLWLLGSIAVVQIGVIAWQWLELIRLRDTRPNGRMVTLAADLPVLLATNGEQVFVIPKGSRIQESTPRGFAKPLERSGDEYIVVLRTGGGPRGPALLQAHRSWMDDYVVRHVDAQ